MTHLKNVLDYEFSCSPMCFLARNDAQDSSTGKLDEFKKIAYQAILIEGSCQGSCLLMFDHVFKFSSYRAGAPSSDVSQPGK